MVSSSLELCKSTTSDCSRGVGSLSSRGGSVAVFHLLSLPELDAERSRRGWSGSGVRADVLDRVSW